MGKITFSEFLAEIEKASFRRAVSVTIEPVTLLERWSVRLVHADFDGKGSSLHLVGWAGYEGRVCSPIQSWDAARRCGISRSGREYRLVGPSGRDVDAEYVWDCWIRRNGDPGWEDVTHQFVNSDCSCMG